jgi:hypothetical protein
MVTQLWIVYSSHESFVSERNSVREVFHVFIYFISLHVSNITMLIIRRSNCINTSSGMISLCKWLFVMQSSCLLTGIPSSHLHRLIIPDDTLIQFDLLMMSIVILETRREMKWINIWKSASSWSLARIFVWQCRYMNNVSSIYRTFSNHIKNTQTKHQLP